jgi:hypothetical protein
LKEAEPEKGTDAVAVVLGSCGGEGLAARGSLARLMIGLLHGWLKETPTEQLAEELHKSRSL